MRGRLAQQMLLVRAVDVDEARMAVGSRAAVLAVFKSVEPENAREDVVASAIAAPLVRPQNFAGYGLSRDEGLAGDGVAPDPERAAKLLREVRA